MTELRAAVHGATEWPTLSVVMPIRNEAPHLERAVASILAQEYPVPFDVCLAVAPSEDATEAIARAIAERESRVSVVSNPAATTPAGLNAAIAATSGEIVVRVDGHAELSPGYINRAVATMRRTGAVNVGGLQNATSVTAFEETVAAAMTSWVGTGGSRFHVGGVEGPVDTVYLGVFDRAAGDLVGWFDETLLRNQDYELNIRLRSAGGVVWFDPQLAVSYRPRGSLRALGRQYYEYGLWKATVARMHPGALKFRQIAPPMALAGAPFVALGAWRSPTVRWVGAATASVVSILLAREARSARVGPCRFAIVVTTMHTAWSVGFWRGLAGQIRRSVRTRLRPLDST